MLTVDSRGEIGWEAGGSGGTTYTAGDYIDITNSTISAVMYDPNEPFEGGLIDNFDLYKAGVLPYEISASVYAAPSTEVIQEEVEEEVFEDVTYKYIEFVQDGKVFPNKSTISLFYFYDEENMSEITGREMAAWGVDPNYYAGYGDLTDKEESTEGEIILTTAYSSANNETTFHIKWKAEYFTDIEQIVSVQIYCNAQESGGSTPTPVSSIEADGATIINNDGVISTAIGGSKTQLWEKALFFEWNSTDYPSVTATQAANNNSIKMSAKSGHYLQTMDYFGGSSSTTASFTALYNHLGNKKYEQIKWYIEATLSDDSVLTGTLQYDQKVSNGINSYRWTSNDSGDTIVYAYMPYNSDDSQQALLWINPPTKAARTCNEIKVYIEPMYSYNTIDAGAVAMDDDYIFIRNDKLRTGLKRIDDGFYSINFDNTNNAGALIISSGGNLTSLINPTGTLAVGTNNNCSNGNRNIMLGKNHNVTHFDTRLIGQYLQSNANSQTLLGQYNSTSTAPFVIGMGSGNNARVDAMTIDASANTVFAGTVTAPGFSASTTDNSTSILSSGLNSSANYYDDSDPNDPVLEGSGSSSITADEISVSYESQIDDTIQQTKISPDGIHFIQTEPDPENPGDTITTNWHWSTGYITLTDQLIGNIYQLSIENGQIVLTNTTPR